MNFKEVKQAFRQASGRYGLIGEDGTDNGGAKFIQWGQDMLNLMLPRVWNKTAQPVVIVAGQYLVHFPYTRSIDRVWIFDANSIRIELIKKNESSLLSEYTNLSDTSIRGIPLYWAPSIRRPSGLEASMTRTILLAPPADQGYQMEIEKHFKAEAFEEDEDESFWSVNYPNTLIHAACYQLELFYRNTEGAKDWKAAIMEVINGLDNDEVRNTLTERMVMNG